MTGTWVPDPVDPNMMCHLDGIPWDLAPIPRRWHRCTPQTKGFTRSGEHVLRCACGGISIGLGAWWGERNSRRKVK